VYFGDRSLDLPLKAARGSGVVVIAPSRIRALSDPRAATPGQGKHPGLWMTRQGNRGFLFQVAFVLRGQKPTPKARKKEKWLCTGPGRQPGNGVKKLGPWH